MIGSESRAPNLNAQGSFCTSICEMTFYYCLTYNIKDEYHDKRTSIITKIAVLFNDTWVQTLSRARVQGSEIWSNPHWVKLWQQYMEYSTG